MTEPIIVVGPGRCGTSCVTGVLHHLGVFVGSNLLGADATNPWGHFEDCDFLNLNASFLNHKLSRGEWSLRVQQVIDERRALGRPWGWKDPRTCNLLRLYLNFFNDPRFVRCVRSAERIEDSVIRAYGDRGWTREDAHRMRVGREGELDRYLPWYRTIEIDFDQLRRHRDKTVSALIEFCGLGPVPADKVAASIEFIRPLAAAG